MPSALCGACGANRVPACKISSVVAPPPSLVTQVRDQANPVQKPTILPLSEAISGTTFRTVPCRLICTLILAQTEPVHLPKSWRCVPNHLAQEDRSSDSKTLNRTPIATATATQTCPICSGPLRPGPSRPWTGPCFPSRCRRRRRWSATTGCWPSIAKTWSAQRSCYR